MAELQQNWELPSMMPIIQSPVNNRVIFAALFVINGDSLCWIVYMSALLSKFPMRKRGKIIFSPFQIICNTYLFLKFQIGCNINIGMSSLYFSPRHLGRAFYFPVIDIQY